MASDCLRRRKMMARILNVKAKTRTSGEARKSDRVLIFSSGLLAMGRTWRKKHFSAQTTCIYRSFLIEHSQALPVLSHCLLY